MTAVAQLLTELGLDVVTAPMDECDTYVVVLVIGEVYDNEASAQQAAEEAHARLTDAMDADLNGPIRVVAERLVLPTGPSTAAIAARSAAAARAAVSGCP